MRKISKQVEAVGYLPMTTSTEGLVGRISHPVQNLTRLVNSVGVAIEEMKKQLNKSNYPKKSNLTLPIIRIYDRVWH